MQQSWAREEMSDMAAVWLPVDDAIAFDVAWVIDRLDTRVELRRANAPPGVDGIVRLEEEVFESLTQVTSNPNNTYSDFVQLPDVNTPAMLNNLRLRYSSDNIYTSIGPNCLVTLNPYKALEICQAEHVSSLAHEADPEDSPPHIFKIARSAYAKMLQTACAQ